MNPKTLAVVGGFALAATVAGCTLSRSDLRHEPFFAKVGGGGGQVVEPKRCTLTVTIVPRTLHDRVVNEAVWSAADEQVVPSETRRGLAANGLRVGMIEGTLPAELDAVLHAQTPDKIEPAEFNLPDGSNTLIALAEATPQATLLLNREGRTLGKDYKDASGWLRVTANHAGATGVALRIVPEIHHGPVSRRYDALQANAASLNTMQFTLKDGQQEETLRELAATLTLQPGQTLVIGSDPDRAGSLASFLFTQTQANSDRLTQKVVLVRASRSNIGVPGSQPTETPKLVPVDPPELLPLPR